MKFGRRWHIAGIAILVLAIAFAAGAVRRHAPAHDSSGTAGAGNLAINAFPWANVTSIRNLTTGAAVELDGPLVTPATAVNLPPGRYEVALVNPRFDKQFTRTVAIAAHRDTILNVEFTPAAHARRALIGDLQAAERELTSKLDAAPSGETLLLRGCARYTRAMLTSAPDAGLAAARDDFKAALKLDRELQLDTLLFSPKLIAFFEEVRRGG
ncbi:MAG TPA: PEGA domain-containing protein [Thermoanaerobaculia bacterium]|nr:PEGA domain-containing protein [Thermoanaerobaculia bacterium]